MDELIIGEYEKNAELLKVIHQLMQDKDALKARAEYWEERAVRAEAMAEEAGELLEDERESCECLKEIVERLRK